MHNQIQESWDDDEPDPDQLEWIDSNDSQKVMREIFRVEARKGNNVVFAKSLAVELNMRHGFAACAHLRKQDIHDSKCREIEGCDWVATITPHGVEVRHKYVAETMSAVRSNLTVATSMIVNDMENSDEKKQRLWREFVADMKGLFTKRVSLPIAQARVNAFLALGYDNEPINPEDTQVKYFNSKDWLFAYHQQKVSSFEFGPL